MKTKTKLLALTAILLLTCLLFAEDDICNMELVSTWNSPPAYGLTENGVEIDIKDSIIYFANSNELYILSSSASGELTLLDSFGLSEVKYTQVIDSFLFTFQGEPLYGSFIHDISNSAEPESVSFIESIGFEMLKKDSIIYSYYGKFYNFANPESVTLIGEAEASSKYFDFDSMFSYETHCYDHSVFPDPPGSRIESFIRLRKFVGYDSSYVVLDTNFWGGVYLYDYAGCLTVKDTLVFIHGPGGLATCTMSRNGSSIILHDIYDLYRPDNGPYKMEIVKDSLIIMCHGSGLTIAKITSPPGLELYAEYQKDPTFGCYDFCVKDSFIYAIVERDSSDTFLLSIMTFKFGTDSLNQCSFNYIPDDFKFDPYPNPFNSRLQIDYNLQQKHAELSIFDTNGRKIEDRTLLDNRGSIFWDASGYSSGIYLIRLQTNKEILIKKVIYIA